MFPKASVAALNRSLKTLSRRMPRTICALMLIAAILVCVPCFIAFNGRWLPESFAARNSGSAFAPAPSLSTEREQHSATQLLNGRLLVAGGRNAAGALDTAQLYDPATGAWTNTGNLRTARYGHAAVLLQNGRVLVAGGRNTAGAYLNSAELYDPATGVWTATGSLATARSRATASLLPATSSTSPGAKVLLVAGEGAGGASLRTAELYNPLTGLWEPAAAPANARSEHTATLLSNGRLLIAGGTNNGAVVRTAEIYSPIANAWTVGGALQTPRSRHTATALADGRVLVAGGESAGTPLTAAELYNPSTNVWTTTNPLGQARRSHSATLLANGRVLIAGGFGNGALNGYQLFDPATNTWGGGGNLVNARANHTATLLSNGAALLAGGGLENGTFLSSVEQLEFSTPSWSLTGTFSAARQLHATTVLADGSVLLSGGDASGQSLNSSQIYNPLTRTWSPTLNNLQAARDTHTSTLLPNGRVLVTGGEQYSNGQRVQTLGSAELYDPSTRRWSLASSLTARAEHTATVLPGSGKVLIAGGRNANSLVTTNSTQLYNPATGQWEPTGEMRVRRYAHTATLLSDGRVLVVGGIGSTGTLRSAEIYTPATGTWSNAAADVGQPLEFRDGHAAVPLPNGKVLVMGGRIGGNTLNLLNNAELYDPATRSWTNLPTMNSSRFLPQAVLLLNGRVLVCGGLSRDQFNQLVRLDTAEIFDPANNNWSRTDDLTDGRNNHRIALLLNGQVMVTGGSGQSGQLTSTTELFNSGLGFSEEALPSIVRVTLTNGIFTLTGVRFQSASEGASGNSQSSAGNFPMVMLRDADSGQTQILAPGPNGWSNNGFTAQALTNPPAGYSLLTVVTNGVPGPAQAFSANAGAASTINLSGRVSNPNNSGFRATMTLRSSIGEVRTTQTNANGEYSFSALPAAPPPTATPTPTPTPTTARLLSMSPHARQVNSGAFTIQVTGSGFTTSSVVQWNGQNRATTFTSATSLSATIQAGDVALTGNPTVTVTNGGASSNGLCFTITPTSAIITSLSQASASAGTGGLTVSINGFFSVGDQARWNGANRTTTILTGSVLRISLTAADLAFAGTGRITVFHSEPEIPPFTSNELCFTITPNTASLLSTASLAPEQQGVTYTVTPSGTLPDGTAATFTPPSRTFSSLNGDVTNATFVVNSVSRSLIVKVTTPTNAPLPQVTINIEFRGQDDMYQLYDEPKPTDSTGENRRNLETGVAYRIKAQRTGYVFSFPSAADAEYLDIPELKMNDTVQCIGRLAVSPPDATTTAASGVTTTTATLNGAVNPNGADSSYYFEWGSEATLAGARRTNTRSAGAGSSPQTVSETINGLAPGQTYYFRLVTTNGGGVNEGTTLSFMTLALCPTISSLTPATAAIGETITINGANLDGVTSIRFAGNIPALFTRAGDTKLFVTVPVGAGNGPITLSKAGCADALSPAFLPATACEAGVELRADDGTSETSVGFGDGFETAYFANRLTPATYPATLQSVSLRLLGLPAGSPITILAAANPGGTNNINGLTFQRIASVVRSEDLERYPITPLTIGSGDFVLGVLFNNPPGLFPIASDTSSTKQKRSYYSFNGESFILFEDHNFFIRAQLQQPSQNCGADLSLTKTHTGNFIPGNNGNYTLTVRNGGPGTTAGTITLTDTLPAGLSFISSAGSGWNFAVAGQNITCTNPGPLPPNTSSVITLTVAVSNTTAATVTNTATVSVANDSNSTNNTASDLTLICRYTISPSTQAFGATGGSNNIAVTAAGGCPWTATSNVNWIVVNSGASGNGNGTVNYSVQANPGAQRTGTLTIAGQTFTVTQAAAPPPTISLSPASLSVAVGGSQSLTVNLSVAQTSAVSIALASSNAAVATVPASVLIPANATSASFNVSGVAAGGPVTITATLPANLGGGSATAGVQVNAAVIVRIGAASGSPGGTVAVPIELASTGNVNGIGFSLNFNTAILNAPQIALGSDGGGASFNPNVSQLAQGRLGVTLALPGNQTFATGTRQILLVSFTIAAGVTATSSPLTFGSQPITQEIADTAANVLPANFQNGAVTITQGLEADVAPRPNGNGSLSLTDWVQTGRFISGADTPAAGSEFQRADCAPKNTAGNGSLSLTDWVQAGRYAAGLDEPVPAAGPTAPNSAFSFTGSFTGEDFAAQLLKRLNRPDARTLRLRTRAETPGAESSVQIELDAPGGENAIGFSLSFDAARWRLLSVATEIESATLLVNRTQLKAGKLGIAMALNALETLPPGKHLLVTLRLAPLSPRAGSGDFSFSDTPINREAAGAAADSLPLNFAREDERPLTVVSAANFSEQRLARDSIAVAIGNNLHGQTGGTQVWLLDAEGVEHSARLLSVSPEQIAFQIPADAAIGSARLAIRNQSGPSEMVFATQAEIVEAAPAVFSTTLENQRWPAAALLRIHSDGRLSYDPIWRLAFGEEEQLILVLFGTGLRHHQGRVSAQIGAIQLPVLYAGPQGEFAGLDQLNLSLPRSLAGSGEMILKLSVDGHPANPLRLVIN